MIYTITVVDQRHKRHCVGYLTELWAARREVAANAGDMCEGSNLWAVIEGVDQGIYTVPAVEYWYKWNLDSERYEPCDKPHFAIGLSNWGIG
jgi:hypothetical protein